MISKTDSKSNPTPGLPDQVSGNPPATVLVVDDQESNRLLLCDQLEARGYTSIEAADGEEALEKAATDPPDVILLDIMMPALNGFDVCRRLKANPKLAHVPIIIVTALNQHREQRLAMEAGANDFLAKPVDVADLIFRVCSAIRSKRLLEHHQQELLRKAS